MFLFPRKPMTRQPSDPGNGRLNTTAYPSANGYDYYRQPPERNDYRSPVSNNDYYGLAARSAGGYDRPPSGTSQSGGAGGGGYSMQQSQQKPYDSQSALQTQPIFF